MPEELCLLEVHKHVVHCIGASGVPLNQTPFLAPKVPSMQNAPNWSVAYQPKIFFRKIPNHNQSVLQKQTAQFQLAG